MSGCNVWSDHLTEDGRLCALMINSKVVTNVIIHSIAELTVQVCDDDLGFAVSAHNLGNELSHCASLLVLNGLSLRPLCQVVRKNTNISIFIGLSLLERSNKVDANLFKATIWWRDWVEDSRNLSQMVIPLAFITGS